MNKRHEDLPLKEVNDLLKKLPPNVKIRVYYDSEEKRVVDIVKPIRHKPTLSQRMNKLEASISELTKIVKDGFIELRQEIKEINARLDNVEMRLDNVEKRLDYNGLQIERIEKRLDYNNLKQLPNSK